VHNHQEEAMFAGHADLDIRRARPGDAGPITALSARAYAKHIPGMGRTPRPVSADYGQAIRDDAIWVVQRGHDLVAVLRLAQKDDHFHIINVAVEPDWQGRGLGKALIGVAEAESLKRGFSSLHLHTDETMADNLALYAAVGFRETHREPYQASQVVYMRKDLTGTSGG
jgi:ribosomal protein S18 acetylase RimI-like enzyme